MARFRTLVGLGLASSMMLAGPVFAATSPSSPATAAKPAMHASAKQAAATSVGAKDKAKSHAAKHTASTSSKTHLAQAKLSNGKTVTYNCSLPGNKNKQACKG